MDPIYTVTIPQLRKAFPFLPDAGIGNDFFIIEDDGKALGQNPLMLEIIKHPIRFDGLFFFYCIEGEFDVDINLHTYTIRPESMVIITPGNIIRMPDTALERKDSIHSISIGMSKEFVTGLRVDFSKIFEESLQVISQPCIHLTEAQIDLAQDYLRLCRKLIDSPIRNKKDVVGTLVSSLAYMAGDVRQRGLTSAREQSSIQGSTRAKMLLERFLALVAEHHTTERGMAFYADKLCLTPKYLSKVIKQVSGQSAPDWIDSFVILEAKNMLRYSEIPIKEIVYRLHFPNQSVFYKFFKMHTGMTPSEFRRG